MAQARCLSASLSFFVSLSFLLSLSLSLFIVVHSQRRRDPYICIKHWNESSKLSFMIIHSTLYMQMLGSVCLCAHSRTKKVRKQEIKPLFMIYKSP
mmetsp:Transcript_89321/g.130666  ORF Transcript_89321/g.130666 Transcript_89321/m.130666 type:complete len:96 (-) Transcript_89321:152-439(-)